MIGVGEITEAAVAVGLTGAAMETAKGFRAEQPRDRQGLIAMADQAGYDLVEDTGDRLVFERRASYTDAGMTDRGGDFGMGF